MTAFDRNKFEAGFSLPRNLLGERPDQVSGLFGRGLRQAGAVTDAQIPENLAQSRQFQSAGRHHRPSTYAVSGPDFIAQGDGGRRIGLRLLPLEDFLWATQAPAACPTTRRDHALIWVTQGLMRLNYPARHHSMTRGMLRFVPAGTAFALHPGAGLRGQVLLLAAPMLNEVEPTFPDHGRDMAVGQGDALETLLQRLDDIATNAGSEALLHPALCALSRLLKKLDPPGPANARSSGGDAEQPLIDRFMALADARLCDGATIADLAGELGCSSATLDRACFDAYGKRAVELLHDLRLERAIDLLRHSNGHPAQIALALGYTSHAHFTRAVIAATGRRPEVFRARY